jgi:uncharacterized protein
MVPLVEQHARELSELCRRFRVERLYLFGSAATGSFDPHQSDLDFLVQLADRGPTGGYADRYLGLAEALEALFGRPVDLVTVESIRNPFFRGEIERTCQVVYGQSREEAAV